MGQGMEFGALGIGRLEPEAAGAFDRAEQDLQQMERPAGLEAVGMGRDAAHGVEADRAAGDGLVPRAAEVGPGLVYGDGLFERRIGEFGGDALDGGGGDAGALGDSFGGVVVREVAVRQALEDGGEPVEGAVQRGFHARLVEGLGGAGDTVPDQLLAVFVAGEETVGVQQHRRVGGAAEVVEVDLAGLQQLVDQSKDEQAVGARRDPDPFVGDGVVAGAHRVDRDDLGAALLEAAQAHLDRVGVMILGDAEDHEELGLFPVGGAEFPERAAQRVDAGGRHVDRAEAAMRGVVRRAELLRPPAGQRLALVAPGEEGELLGVALADRR